MPQSISQVNRLGERLRKGLTSDEDVAALADFQKEFQPLFRDTIRLMAELSKRAGGKNTFGPTGRIKQLRSIVDKLQRQSTRLAQLQDIVGCRVVVQTMANQDALVAALPFSPEWRVSDRRNDPQHGYRAVHAIRTAGSYRVEVQIRTLAQHLWAELSEALDRYFPGLKYGQGDVGMLDGLNELSDKLARVEQGAPAEDALLSDELADERMAIVLTTAAMMVIGSLRSERKQQP